MPDVRDCICISVGIIPRYFYFQDICSDEMRPLSSRNIRERAGDES